MGHNKRAAAGFAKIAREMAEIEERIRDEIGDPESGLTPPQRAEDLRILREVLALKERCLDSAIECGLTE